MKLLHIIFGHGDNYEVLETLRSEKHPASDNDWIYTINICKCKGCGLTFNDAGLECRDFDKWWKGV